MNRKPVVALPEVGSDLGRREPKLIRKIVRQRRKSS